MFHRTHVFLQRGQLAFRIFFTMGSFPDFLLSTQKNKTIYKKRYPQERLHDRQIKHTQRHSNFHSASCVSQNKQILAIIKMIQNAFTGLTTSCTPYVQLRTFSSWSPRAEKLQCILPAAGARWSVTALSSTLPQTCIFCII